MSRPPLLCITGQTASGKSSLALDLARAISAEILSVDSMQVFRGFDIGTAKPSVAERASVRHHGIDLVAPGEPFSAGAFLRYARGIVQDALGRGVPLIAVGGTGLYLRALIHGLAEAPEADPVLRARLREEEAAVPGSMHGRLLRVDPEAAGRLHPNDLVRIERAIEVSERGGGRLSLLQQGHAFREAPFRTWLVGIRWPRPALRGRIDERVDDMLARGWVDEVRGLHAAGVPWDAVPMRALGYAQIAAMLRGELDPGLLRERIAAATRRFAKRQATWFNREPSIEWMDPDDGLASLLLPRARAFLSAGPPPRGP